MKRILQFHHTLNIHLDLEWCMWTTLPYILFCLAVDWSITSTLCIGRVKVHFWSFLGLVSDYPCFESFRYDNANHLATLLTRQAIFASELTGKAIKSSPTFLQSRRVRLLLHKTLLPRDILWPSQSFNTSLTCFIFLCALITTDLSISCWLDFYSWPLGQGLLYLWFINQSHTYTGPTSSSVKISSSMKHLPPYFCSSLTPF